MRSAVRGKTPAEIEPTRLKQRVAASLSEGISRVDLERIVGGNDLMSVKFILLIFLFMLSGFFSSSEAAFFSLTPLHLHKMREERYPFLSHDVHSPPGLSPISKMVARYPFILA